ncbi:RadC family protein [Roseomonas elaeocarpi]|uniref:DNA repair protein RadC n=1 Tax=Roseomonas elaeocarpi TaxID=907779 RepID=A0ABV6JPN1_9PROT
MTERGWSAAGPAQEDVDWGRPARAPGAVSPVTASPTEADSGSAGQAGGSIGPSQGFAEAPQNFAEQPPGLAGAFGGFDGTATDSAGAPCSLDGTPGGFADAAGFALRDVERLLREAEQQLRRSPPDSGLAGVSRGVPPGESPGMAPPMVPAAFPPPGAIDDTAWDPLALRRRLLNHGHEGLAEEELAALLLGLALPTDPRPLARAAVRHFGSFAALLSAGDRELRALRGFGTHGVAAVRLVQAAALRLRRAEVMRQTVLDRWDRVIAYLNAALARERVEQFRVLFLDVADRLVADEAQARGTVNHTPVYPREVARRALELDAAGVILVHNHPSGDPTPSREDLGMTAQVREALDALGLRLIDHVIVGNGRHASFRAEGLL